MLLISNAWAEEAASIDNPLNTLALSSISGGDLAPQFRRYLLASTPIPQNHRDLSNWLASLQPMQSSPSMGDVFVAAVNIYNDTDEQRWFVNPYEPTVEDIEIYFFSDNQHSVARSGLRHESEILTHSGKGFILPSGKAGTLLLVYASDFYFSDIKIRILKESQTNSVINSKIIIVLMALGVLAALTVYNLFLFFAGRLRVYLYLTICIFFLGFGWFNIYGIYRFLGPELSIYLLISPFLLSSAFALQFTRQFLNLRQISFNLDVAFVGLFWGCMLALPITFVSPAYGIYIVYGVISIMVGISLLAGTVAWNKHYKPAKYFVLAYAAFSVQTLMWFATQIIPELAAHLSTAFVGLMAGTVGALLLSLSLAAKVSLITFENRQMANNLEQKVYERTEALAEANVALEHLISELQEASSAKSNFLANMSHEIRTPLTAIIGYADGILMGDIDKDEQERVIQVISENGNHLLHIISDILDISKIEADKLEYEMLPSRVTDIITQVESVMAKRARDKDLEFNLNFHFPIPSEIETDPYRFKQILLNLTNNAIKFTEKGHISIDIHYENEELTVCVEDTGMGMSREQIAAIFAPFEQGGSSIARQFGGTGLGLSISKRLALDLGGDIIAKSEAGKGSSFEVRIKAVPTNDNQMLYSLNDILNIQEIKEEEATQPDFTGGKILLVDDHPNNRDLIKIILNRMNVDVTEAEDGDIALQKVFEEEFDLILMDIQMPRMKGDEATEKLRQLGYDLPVIALTANNMKHEIESYMKIGFDGHLSKPIVRNDFIATLNVYLKSKGSTESLFSNDEMLGLVSGYHSDLHEQITQVEQVWAEKNITEFIEISHRIKGAAGSFGFAALGDKFAEIEQLAKDDELDKVEALLPEVIRYSRLCSDIPGFDIPKGVVKFDMNIDFLLTEIQQFCNTIADDLESLCSCVGRGENNIALLYLNRITPKAKKLGWLDLHKMSSDLEKQIKQSIADSQSNLAMAEALQNEINRVKALFD